MWSGSKSINEDQAGNYIHYGVREFGMTAITNGIALHGGFLPYSATFLMFVEYARNAVRMAALMKIRHVLVYTHDSIGLGEDGPTHQPVEQIASLRVTPNMSTWRPADQVESAVAWKYAIERNDGPVTLIFSRQNLAQQPRTAEQLANVARGGYVLKDCDGTPEVILIATGSEVECQWQRLINWRLQALKYALCPCHLLMPSTNRMRLTVNPSCRKRLLHVWRLKQVSLTTGTNTLA